MRTKQLVFLWSLAFAVGSSTISTVPAVAASASRPNIVHIFADDLGKAAVGVHGQLDLAAKGLPNIKTPTLDQLAAVSLTFTRAYSATVCSPSRGMLYLGFNQAHNANDRNTVECASHNMIGSQNFWRLRWT